MRVMCRGWSWGNLGGDCSAKKQAEEKNVVYLLTSISRSGNDYGRTEKEVRKEKYNKEMRFGISTNPSFCRLN